MTKQPMSPPSPTKDTEDTQVWSDIAQVYDRIIPQFSYYQELLQKVVAAVKDASYVLDCGCGTGLIMMALLRENHRVLALDNSPLMLQEALAKVAQLPPALATRVRVEPGDPTQFAEHFQESDLFDGVVCNNVLFYVNDPMEVMRQIRRILRPNGVATFSGPIPDADLELLYRVSKEDFQKRGIYDTFAQDLERFLQFSIMLKKVGHRNTYHATQLADLLHNQIGFSRILHADQDTYHGQSYFVVVQK